MDIATVDISNYDAWQKQAYWHLMQAKKVDPEVDFTKYCLSKAPFKTQDECEAWMQHSRDQADRGQVIAYSQVKKKLSEIIGHEL